MTLAFWSDLVKRQQVTGWVALACTLLVLAGTWLIWHDGNHTRQRATQFGHLLTATLANQGLENVVQADAVHLLALTNGLMALEDVQGAGFYSGDSHPLAESGDMQSRVAPRQEFRQTLRVADSIAGEVRVRLRAAAFTRAPSRYQLIATAALTLFTPFLAMLLAELNHLRPRRLPIVNMEVEADEPALESRYLVVGNFYNQIHFSGDMRREIHSRILPKAQLVAQLYDGQARIFGGGSLLLEFHEDADIAFKAMCAAWLLNEMLIESDPDVEYRFALHRVMASPTRGVRPEVLADVSFLAALTPEDTQVASGEFMTALENKDRCLYGTLEHPMLGDINTFKGPAFTINALNEPHASLMRRQASVMLGHSTAIASTR
ncbi:MAG: hypothetical protein H6993_05110 [Pseudomonadales bacterium]|nr:hypothetical protein [Pseudomonadales bacterium]MCP5183319.1 hypothetical protein [Pseudomonadales bacterium]